MSIQILPNYIGKQWVHPTAVDQVDVINPATTEVINRIPLSSESDVDRAVQSAAQAFKVGVKPLPRIGFSICLP